MARRQPRRPCSRYRFARRFTCLAPSPRRAAASFCPSRLSTTATTTHNLSASATVNTLSTFTPNLREVAKRGHFRIARRGHYGFALTGPLGDLPYPLFVHLAFLVMIVP